MGRPILSPGKKLTGGKFRPVTPPLLALANNTDDLILDTDASDVALGGELIQVQEGQEKVVAYSSFALTPNKGITVQKERNF